MELLNDAGSIQGRMPTIAAALPSLALQPRSALSGSIIAHNGESMLMALQRQAAEQQSLLAKQQLEVLQLAEAARSQQQELAVEQLRLEQRAADLKRLADEIAERERKAKADAEALTAREQAVAEKESRLRALQAQCTEQYLTLRAVHQELQERLLAARLEAQQDGDGPGLCKGLAAGPEATAAMTARHHSSAAAVPDEAAWPQHHFRRNVPEQHNNRHSYPDRRVAEPRPGGLLGGPRDSIPHLRSATWTARVAGIDLVPQPHGVTHRGCDRSFEIDRSRDRGRGAGWDRLRDVDRQRSSDRPRDNEWQRDGDRQGSKRHREACAEREREGTKRRELGGERAQGPDRDAADQRHPGWLPRSEIPPQPAMDGQAMPTSAAAKEAAGASSVTATDTAADTSAPNCNAQGFSVHHSASGDVPMPTAAAAQAVQAANPAGDAMSCPQHQPGSMPSDGEAKPKSGTRQRSQAGCDVVVDAAPSLMGSDRKEEQAAPLGSATTVRTATACHPPHSVHAACSEAIQVVVSGGLCQSDSEILSTSGRPAGEPEEEAQPVAARTGEALDITAETDNYVDDDEDSERCPREEEEEAAAEAEARRQREARQRGWAREEQAPQTQHRNGPKQQQKPLLKQQTHQKQQSQQKQQLQKKQRQSKQPAAAPSPSQQSKKSKGKLQQQLPQQQPQQPQQQPQQQQLPLDERRRMKAERRAQHAAAAEAKQKRKEAHQEKMKRHQENRLLLVQRTEQSPGAQDSGFQGSERNRHEGIGGGAAADSFAADLVASRHPDVAGSEVGLADIRARQLADAPGLAGSAEASKRTLLGPGDPKSTITQEVPASAPAHPGAATKPAAPIVIPPPARKQSAESGKPVDCVLQGSEARVAEEALKQHQQWRPHLAPYIAPSHMHLRRFQQQQRQGHPEHGLQTAAELPQSGPHGSQLWVQQQQSKPQPPRHHTMGAGPGFHLPVGDPPSGTRKSPDTALAASSSAQAPTGVAHEVHARKPPDTVAEAGSTLVQTSKQQQQEQQQPIQQQQPAQAPRTHLIHPKSPPARPIKPPACSLLPADYAANLPPDPNHPHLQQQQQPTQGIAQPPGPPPPGYAPPLVPLGLRGIPFHRRQRNWSQGQQQIGGRGRGNGSDAGGRGRGHGGEMGGRGRGYGRDTSSYNNDGDPDGGLLDEDLARTVDMLRQEQEQVEQAGQLK